MDLVSIIMPSYNSEKYISESIDSIIKQSYSNWELLITDDASTDKTLEIIKGYSKIDQRIKIYKLTQNNGAGNARNNSISQAKGRFIAFCDSDDIWYSSKLSRQVEFLKNNNLSFTYSSYDIQKRNSIVKVNSPLTISYRKILRANYLGCLTVIYDSEKLGKLYMSEVRKRQDWILWIRILSIIESSKGVEESLALYRVRQNSLSGKKIRLFKYIYIVYRESGFSIVSSLLRTLIFPAHQISKNYETNKS